MCFRRVFQMMCCGLGRREKRKTTTSFLLQDLPPAVPAPRPVSVSESSPRLDSIEIQRSNNAPRRPFEDMFVIGEDSPDSDSDSDDDDEDEQQQQQQPPTTTNPFDDSFATSEVMFDSTHDVTNGSNSVAPALSPSNPFDIFVVDDSDDEGGDDDNEVEDSPLVSPDQNNMKPPRSPLASLPGKWVTTTSNTNTTDMIGDGLDEDDNDDELLAELEAGLKLESRKLSLPRLSASLPGKCITNPTNNTTNNNTSGGSNEDNSDDELLAELQAALNLGSGAYSVPQLSSSLPVKHITTTTPTTTGGGSDEDDNGDELLAELEAALKLEPRESSLPRLSASLPGKCITNTTNNDSGSDEDNSGDELLAELQAALNLGSRAYSVPRLSASPPPPSPLRPAPLRLSPTRRNRNNNSPSPLSFSLSGPDSNDTMYGYSAASSNDNEQEAFPHYKKKVLALIPEVFPHDDLSTLIIERMRGGTYNRVVGITIGTPPRRYILRVPRTKDFTPPAQLAMIDITDDIAPLLFVQNAGIPCANILTFDRNPSNPLRIPYMIQTRVKGECLLDALDKLTHPQQCRLAKELGIAYRKMLATTSSVPGRIVIPRNNLSRDDTSTPTASDLRLAPFEPLHAHPWKDRDNTDTRLQPIQSGPPAPGWHISTWMKSVFETRRAITKPNAVGQRYINLYNSYIAGIDRLTRHGYLEDGQINYCLTHGDLWPRNCMVDVDAGPDEPFLTILDWDSAMFLPSFTMAIPPIWVWDRDNYTEPEHDWFDRDPIDPSKRELKRIFEEAAGGEYLRLSSSPVYKDLRIVMYQIVKGVKLKAPNIV